MTQTPVPQLIFSNWLRVLASLASFVMHVESWLALSALAMIISLLDWLSTLPYPFCRQAALLARAIWGIYFFLVVRKAAIGTKRLPTAKDYRDTWDSLLFPLIQLFFALVPYLLLLFVYVKFSISWRDFIESYQAHPSTMLLQRGFGGLAILSLGILYLPAALISTLGCVRAIPLLNPWAVICFPLQATKSYLVTFALFCGLSLASLFFDISGIMLQSSLPIPLAAPVMNNLLRLLIPLAQSRLLGTFYYENRRELRWRHREDLPAG